jgi:hypothetical protein
MMPKFNAPVRLHRRMGRFVERTFIVDHLVDPLIESLAQRAIESMINRIIYPVIML